MGQIKMDVQPVQLSKYELTITGCMKLSGISAFHVNNTQHKHNGYHLKITY
jgi:hypothetical protein